MDSKDIANLFTYHAPTAGQKDQYTCITLAAHYLAEIIMANTPDSHERDIAINAVQSARMWANAGIACHPDKKSTYQPALTKIGQCKKCGRQACLDICQSDICCQCKEEMAP